MSLELSIYNVGATTILRVAGTVNGGEIFRFSHAVRELMQQGSNRIAIDISGIDFMESHALGILVSQFLAMQRQGRELVLINLNSASSYMNRLLDSTRLNEVFKIYTTAQHS